MPGYSAKLTREVACTMLLGPCPCEANPSVEVPFARIPSVPSAVSRQPVQEFHFLIFDRKIECDDRWSGKYFWVGCVMSLDAHAIVCWAASLDRKTHHLDVEIPTHCAAYPVVFAAQDHELNVRLTDSLAIGNPMQERSCKELEL
jgi:hypothetical protein